MNSKIERDDFGSTEIKRREITPTHDVSEDTKCYSGALGGGKAFKYAGPAQRELMTIDVDRIIVDELVDDMITRKMQHMQGCVTVYFNNRPIGTLVGSVIHTYSVPTVNLTTKQKTKIKHLTAQLQRAKVQRNKRMAVELEKEILAIQYGRS